MGYIRDDDLTYEDVMKLARKLGCEDITETYSFGSLVLQAPGNIVGIFFDCATARQWLRELAKERKQREQ